MIQILILLYLLAAVPPKLQNAISEKTKQLQTIQNQIQEQQKNLQETEEKGRTLKNDLKMIEQGIGQLNLGIKSSQLQIEKIGLEIESLEDEIETVNRKISAKKEGIDKTIKEIQRKDSEGLVMVFLKNKSLAESLEEAKNLAGLGEALARDVSELFQFKSELNEKLGMAARKKIDVENEQSSLKTKKSVTEEQKQERQALLVQTKNQEKLYQQAISDLEKMQAAIADEVEALEAELRIQIDPTSLPTARPGVLGLPVNGRVSQGYGATPFARRGGYPGRWHNGIDISGPLGTPIAAAADGTIVAFGDQDKFCRRGAYGKYIVIRHYNNLATLYGHLSRQHDDLQIGKQVKRGEVLGFIGNTGYSRGSHLHFTVYDSKTFGMRPSKNCGLMPSGGDLDPTKYL